MQTCRFQNSFFMKITTPAVSLDPRVRADLATSCDS
jgi:hypothetical protein